MPHRARLIALTAALAACSQRAPAPAGEPEVPVLAAARETAPTAEDGANGVTIWVHPDDAARSLILGAGGTGGLEVYGLDGALRQRIPDIEAAQVMVRYGFDFGGKRAPLVLAYDPVRSALVGFTIEQERLRRLPGAPVLADEARHNLILGIAGTLRDNPTLYDEHHFWLVADGGAVVGAALRTPPYNLVLHTAPLREQVDATYHWHWEIHPRLREIAGLELGTGLPVNPVSPEDAVEELLAQARRPGSARTEASG